MSEKAIPYDKDKFLRGGIYAVLIPVIIGVALSVITVTNRSTGFDFYLWPIICCFIFIAPVVAISSVKELKKRAPFSKEEIFQVGQVKSSAANFYVAIIYNIGFVIYLIGLDGIARSDTMMILFFVFVFGGIIQFILWLVLTVPLTMLCTTIFEKAVSPK